MKKIICLDFKSSILRVKYYNTLFDVSMQFSMKMEIEKFIEFLCMNWDIVEHFLRLTFRSDMTRSNCHFLKTTMRWRFKTFTDSAKHKQRISTKMSILFQNMQMKSYLWLVIYCCSSKVNNKRLWMTFLKTLSLLLFFKKPSSQNWTGENVCFEKVRERLLCFFHRRKRKLKVQ